MEDESQLRNFRYDILDYDTSRLYRTLSKHRGIDTSRRPEINIHEWLDPSSPHHQPSLCEAIFSYAARTNQNDRFKMCIASKEMDNASWKYGHKNQIILDGTFGVCDSRLLLFIVMGVDERRKGIPLAFLLFSAPAGNQQTSAGYNTQILTELLRDWKRHMEQNGSTFTPYTAITDTDTKERGALLNVWPQLILLLCKFHLWQCWKNRRHEIFGSCDAPGLALNDVKTELLTLENEYVQYPYDTLGPA
jgi:hypothetical protein